MPTYDYRCQKCGEDLEVYQSFSDKPLTKHDECGGKLVKVLSPAGIVLKGSGFYKTDSRVSSKTAAKEKTGDNGSRSSDTSSSNSSESKSDSSKSTTKNDGGPSTSKATNTEAKSA